ncbi:hypothetical protein [Carnobacterium sp.]|uniref:hypothetical protein n=1 Tax=Carnobacterium sp. TaxID=48221 RepID=UPI0038907B76
MGRVTLKGMWLLGRSIGFFFSIMFILLIAIDYSYDLPIDLGEKAIQAFLTAASFTLINTVLVKKNHAQN